MKEKNDTRNPKLWRQPFFLGFLALVCVSSSAVFAVVMGLTPLKNQAFHLPHSRKNLTGLIPATLKQPVNILILGIDNSGHPHQSQFSRDQALSGNSDTMLLVRLLPDTHQINILSIPRDTLVQLPSVSHAKINDANVRGGPKLAAEAVSHLLGDIPIDRYVRVDTEGFIHLVDALGGVEVNIPKQMNYTDHTQKLSIHFSPGLQKLNGQHLQEYVRFRHDDLGDIGRVQRQQEVLKNIIRTVLQPATIAKIPQILQVAKDNVDTDLTVQEMLAVTQTVGSSDRRQMHMIVLPGRFSRRDEYRLSYWIADPDLRTEIVSRYFNQASAKPIENDVHLIPPQKQKLKIAVAMATGKPEDGKTVVSFLRKQGFRNVYITRHEIDTGVESARHTQVIAQHGNPEAAYSVSNALGVGEVQVASIGDIFADVTVVVGADLAEKGLQK
ncbi:MAG: LCP family protein [Rhizonema sp. NSF051]|nr:LCP family protein [Rhizonema sp. NSF051]